MTSVIIDFAVSIPGKATALLILGLAAVWVARRSRASLRHLLLAATFAALMVLPAGIAAIPAVGLAIPKPVVSVAVPASARSAMPATAGKTETPALASAWRLPSTTSIAGAVWIAGAVLLLLALGRDIWQLRRLRRTALPATALRDMVQALAAEQGIRRSVDV